MINLYKILLILLVFGCSEYKDKSKSNIQLNHKSEEKATFVIPDSAILGRLVADKDSSYYVVVSEGNKNHINEFLIVEKIDKKRLDTLFIVNRIGIIDKYQDSLVLQFDFDSINSIKSFDGFIEFDFVTDSSFYFSALFNKNTKVEYKMDHELIYWNNKKNKFEFFILKH